MCIRVRRFFSISLLALIISSFTGLGEEWQIDYKHALKQAKEERKKILLNFTGSDWCTWCVRLKKEVFSQPEFVGFAKQHLVLVEVDFPRSKILQETIQKQNAQLCTIHHIKAFPTLILLDCNERKLGERTGYMEEGVGKVIQWMDDVIKR